MDASGVARASADPENEYCLGKGSGAAYATKGQPAAWAGLPLASAVVKTMMAAVLDAPTPAVGGADPANLQCLGTTTTVQDEASEIKEATARRAELPLGPAVTTATAAKDFEMATDRCCG